MAGQKLSEESILAFRDNLILEEKSIYTTEKYLRDVCAFFRFAGAKPVTKELVMDYKKALVGAGYAACSVNSMLASVNSLLSFLGWGDCKVKNLRVQRQTYCAEEKELSKAEYLRLLERPGRTHSSALYCKPFAAPASGFQNCAILRWKRCSMAGLQ